MSSLPPLVTIEDLHAIESVPLDERDIARTTYALLASAAETWPDRPAATFIPDPADFTRSVTWTYTELRAVVDRIASVLIDMGVEREDAVTLMSPNTGMLLAATLAAEAVGIAAPISSAFDADRVAHLLRTTGSRHLIAAGPELDAGLWSLLSDVARDLGLISLLALRPDDPRGPAPELTPVAGVRTGYLEDLAAAAAATPLGERAPRPTDIAAYFHTGGTTGDPKIAAHTHLNEAVTAWSISVAGSIEEASTILAGLPMFHVNAVVVTVISPMVSGGHAVWPGPAGYRDPALYGSFWKIVEHYRPMTMSAVPTVYAVLTTVSVDADISSLEYPVVGASPLADAVRAGFKEHTGLDLCEGYGLTEATCASSATPRGQVRAGTVGRRLPYQQVKAVSFAEDGTVADLPAGETGDIVISGPAVFAGYLRTSRTGRALDTGSDVVEGWLRTGDLGSVSADGFVTLNGRSKDLIIRGGHNIDPRVIEDALLAHPEVSAAGAVGRPDKKAGEVPVAFVVLAPEAEADEASLGAWAAEHIDEPAARPKTVTVLPVLPMTAVGKPFKPGLRELAAVAAAGEDVGGLDVEVSAAHRAGRLVVTVTGSPEATSSAVERLAGHAFVVEAER